MDERQNRILRVLSSIAVGAMAFLLTFPLVLLVGGVLLGPLEGGALIPSELVILLVISVLVALTIAILVGIKYYRFVSKPT